MLCIGIKEELSDLPTFHYHPLQRSPGPSWKVLVLQRDRVHFFLAGIDMFLRTMTKEIPGHVSASHESSAIKIRLH